MTAMFDFDTAKVNRAAEAQASRDAETAKQADINNRVMSLCREFTDFAEREAQAVVASRQGDTVTLNAGPENKMKIKVLPDKSYQVTFDGQHNANHVYDSIDEQYAEDKDLARRIVDWMY